MTWMTGGRVLGVFCRRFSWEKTGVFFCQKERNNEWGFVNVSFKEENSWG